MPDLLITDPDLINFLASAESVRVFERHREDLTQRIVTDEGMTLRGAFAVATLILHEQHINASSENTLAVATSLLDYALYIEVSNR